MEIELLDCSSGDVCLWAFKRQRMFQAKKQATSKLAKHVECKLPIFIICTIAIAQLPFTASSVHPPT